MNTQSFVSHEDALDLLFAHRNRAYGAYQLRRQYPNTLARALGLGLLLIALLAVLPNILKAFTVIPPAKEKSTIIYCSPMDRDITIEQPPPKPPKQRTPPPPARSTQRFVPPVVEADNKVPEEPPKLSNVALQADPADVGKATSVLPDIVAPSLDDPGIGTSITTDPAAPNDDPLELFVLQRPPSFPGGEGELLRFLAKNIKYPDLAREANIQGQVVLSFVVGRDGSIGDVQILKELGGGCSKEAVRVLKTMPRWTPGEANGHAVKVRYTLPVRFNLR